MDAVFAVLGSLSGAGTLARLVTSQSLTDVLPPWALYVWGALLLIGSIAWLSGILSTAHNGAGEVVIRRVPILVLGLSLISTVTLVYGIAVISRGGWAGVIAAIAYFSVSFGTYIRRWVIINRLESPHD
jgi:hypothetical protein